MQIWAFQRKGSFCFKFYWKIFSQLGEILFWNSGCVNWIVSSDRSDRIVSRAGFPIDFDAKSCLSRGQQTPGFISFHCLYHVITHIGPSSLCLHNWSCTESEISHEILREQLSDVTRMKWMCQENNLPISNLLTEINEITLGKESWSASQFCTTVPGGRAIDSSDFMQMV